MDQFRAKRIASELQGKEVGRWAVIDYINYGKSSLVVKATRNGENAALKIFDSDLVERFGREIQLSRIEREKSLIGKSHPNLIEIKDSGASANTNYLFVAMAYLPYENLAHVIANVPRDCIWPSGPGQRSATLSVTIRRWPDWNVGIVEQWNIGHEMNLQWYTGPGGLSCFQAPGIKERHFSAFAPIILSIHYSIVPICAPETPEGE